MITRKHILKVSLCGLVIAVIFGLGFWTGRRWKVPPVLNLEQVVLPEKEKVSKLRSTHFPPFGMPRIRDARYNFVPQNQQAEVPGISVIVREGFVVEHLDKFKVPLVVCERWSRHDLETADANKNPDRRFQADPELPLFAQGFPNYHIKGELSFDMGHMADHQDADAWGIDNSLTADFMSNIVPQRPRLNRGPWLKLENLHHKVVGSGPVESIWIMAGSAFENGKPMCWVGNEIGVPSYTFKILCWNDGDNDFQARGFLYPQEAQKSDPLVYLVPIREIEEKTGLCFFPEMEPEASEKVKGNLPTTIFN